MKRSLLGLTVVALLVSPAFGAILYDNGPLVTNPGGGFGGADLSALETAIGENILGYGHQVSAGNRVADDFTVPAGGWTIDEITFFAYQTGAPSSGTITAVNLRIWDGNPMTPGSNVVFGDVTTNRLASTGFANMYRATDADPLGNLRAVQENVCTVGTTLAAGTYWLDWQTDGSASFSGPWVPPVTIAGITNPPGANALQSIAGSWAPLQDSGSLTPDALPFVISGVPEPATGLLLLVLGGWVARRR